MKILHISNFRHRGGGTAVARQLAEADAADSILLFLEQERVRLGPEGSPTAQYACHWSDFRFADRVARSALEKNCSLIVHCHGRRPGLVGRYLRAMHPRRIRVVMSFHGIASSRPPKRWLAALQEVLLSPLTDQFVAAAPAEVALFRSLPLARAIVTIPNAYNPHAVVNWLPRPVRRLGFCARFEFPKLHEDLIRVVASHNRHSSTPVTLVFAGDGSRRAAVDRLGGKILGDSYQSLGHIPDIRAFYGQIDAFAHFSLFEGLGNALIDAMACGMPCLASDVIGCRDAIERDVSGLLVPVHDLPAGVAALRRIVDRPEDAARLAAAARRRAITVFSPEAFCRSYGNIYESLDREMRREPAGSST
jgi:glycosyltransferase involved in cell wall biosynthesis